MGAILNKEMIYLGADHAGFELKEKIKEDLIKKGQKVADLGAHTLDKNDDYPDYAKAVADKVAADSSAKGILFCGSAEGVCIAANKVKGIRAVAVWSTTNAKMSRAHNDANVLCLSGGQTLEPIPATSFEEAREIVDTWLATPFSGAERHQRRIQKIHELEK